jgi:ferredoxin
VKVRVDEERCQGHSRCMALAPELFEVDDYGMSHVLIEGDVPADLEDKAKLAAVNCPERAIIIE